MSYIGNQPQYASFLSDTFSGNGSTTVYTMAVAPANTAAVLVAIWGVLQDPTTYGVVGRTLTFSQAPPAGTGNISVRYLALPASNVTTTAYRSVTEFTATAGQTTFTPASYTPGFINVFRSGVRLGTSNFTATNGVTVVLTNAAAAGDLITIESFFVSSVLNAIPSVSGAVSSSLLDTTGQSGSGAMILPTGTTAQRPASPVAGMTRMNTTTGNPEWWDTASAQWIPYSDGRPYAVDYLVVAGGGGGGGGEATNGFGGGGAGGGAGGYISATANITPGQLYSIIIGGGGAGGTSVGNVPSPSSSSGSPGSGSSLSGLGISATAIAGGFGAQDENSAGGNGGSGGGAGGDSGGQPAGSGTSGQGNAGAQTQASRSGGGGGGAGSIATTRTGGNGSTWLNGTTYAGGGGGGAGGASTSTAPGGTGGGGTGAATTGNSAANAGDGGNTPGGANTGGGGGGDAASRNAGGKAGGSGIVIIRYAGSQRALGGTISSAGGFTFHTFTSSGTYTA
jgi:hypothetical protein